MQPIDGASSVAPMQDPNVNSNGAGVAGVANPTPPAQGSPAPTATAVVGMKHADTTMLNQGYPVENAVGGQTMSNPPAPAQNNPVGNNGGVSGQSNLPPSAATPPGGCTIGGSAMVEPIAQAQVRQLLHPKRSSRVVQ